MMRNFDFTKIKNATTHFIACGRFSFQMGFSLLEMLMVLVVVGVLASVGVPAYQRLSAQIEINSVARQFAQQAEAARAIAQANSTVLALCPVSPDSVGAAVPSCINLLVRQPWTAWVWHDINTGQVIFRSQPLPATVALTWNSVNYPSFDGSGRLVGLAAGTIEVQSTQVNLVAAVTAKVILNSRGQITAEVP